MGVLAPLYLAGLAALSLPLIFHLVRRTPRGRQQFSSLMFLLPSPPRLTRRSRLDQLLLLLLRLAALALLAFAFARPFLREAATLALDELPARRVAILVDASASMRRGDLWRQVLARVEQELAELGPHDEIALFSFGDRLETVVGFEAGEADAVTSHVEVVRQAAKKLRPTWEATDLGTALVAVASEVAATGDVKQSAAEPQIIVISDFQKGAKLDALQAFEWPQRVRVINRRLAPKRPTNALVQLLSSEEDSPDAEPRVRVASAADSKDDQFFVAWAAKTDGPAAKSSTSHETAVYVPPGQSRVVKLPRPEDNLQGDRIVLRGDEHDFDNTFYVVPPRKQQVKMLYAGADAPDDEQGPQFYLKLATSGDPLRQVEVQPLANDDTATLTSSSSPQVIVVTRPLSVTLVAALKIYTEQGGTLVLAPADQEAAQSIPTLFDDVELSPKPAAAGDYLLLGEIDFTHPLFAPFANPRYNDFTKIHFWKHRSLALGDDATTKAVAKFDNGEPAILERALGKGRIIMFASGWHPEDSELALSTKFVPLIAVLLDRACGTTGALANVTIGQPVPLPASASEAIVVQKPDGTDARITEDRPSLASHHSPSFTDTHQPGIYTIVSLAEPQHFAVNLSAAESNTAPLELEQLEQLGVKTGVKLTRAEQLKRIRQQRDTELEARQKIWRWLLVAALAVLVLETAWAGRATRQIAQAEILA